MSDFEHQNNDMIVGKAGQALYISIVDALNWLAVQTRPDVAFDVTKLSTYFGKATETSMRSTNVSKWSRMRKLKSCTQSWKM